MKNNKILIQLIIVLTIISCGHNQKRDEAKSLNNLISVNNDFEIFSSKFKLLEVEQLSKLGDVFTNKYLASEDSLILIDKKFKEKFLPDINTSSVYYGFKTPLQNQAIILTVLNHQEKSYLNKDGEPIDTTFLTSIVYSNSGKILSSFRIFGSNMTGVPPTYNLKSIFQFDKDKLVIYNYEYSTGKSYLSCNYIPEDTLCIADLTVTKLYLDYNTNTVKVINKLKKKTKVRESYSSPTYLEEIQ